MESFVLTLTLVVFVSWADDPAKEAKEYPFIVTILRKEDIERRFLCAGSLIASSWVLTTAHCLPKVANKIRYGDMMAANGTYRRILRRYHHMNTRSRISLVARVHPRLTPKTNNIGLALIQEIPDGALGKLSGIDYTSLVGSKVSYFEFGYEPEYKSKIYIFSRRRVNSGVKRIKMKKEAFLRTGMKILHKTKKKSKLKSLQNGTYEKVLRSADGVVITCRDKRLPGPNICVASKCRDFYVEDPMALVSPDYGAPLIHDQRIIGVTTEVEEFYSTYTPVSLFLTWIHEVMANTRCERFLKSQNTIN